MHPDARAHSRLYETVSNKEVVNKHCLTFTHFTISNCVVDIQVVHRNVPESWVLLACIQTGANLTIVGSLKTIVESVREKGCFDALTRWVRAIVFEMFFDEGLFNLIMLVLCQSCSKILTANVSFPLVCKFGARAP